MTKFKINFNFHDDGSVFVNSVNAGTVKNAALNVNVTGQTGEDSSGVKQDLSAEMKTFYDKVLIRSAEPYLVHDQFGQKRPIPKGSGKTIEFRQFSTLPKALTPLTEGVTPDGQKYSVMAFHATVQQYGAYIAISDMLELTAFDNQMAEITKMLGAQAGLTSDTITRDELCQSTNVIRPNDRAQRTDLVAGDILSVKDIKKAVRALKRKNIPTIGGNYVAIVHPDTVYDLWNDDEWIEASKYAGSTQIFQGEVGKLYGVRFVESTEAKIFENGVYATLVLGENAFGVTSINNGGIETITKQLGSGGSSDPLNQRATVGWKMNKAVKILEQSRMVMIEHKSSLTSAAAN